MRRPARLHVQAARSKRVVVINTLALIIGVSGVIYSLTPDAGSGVASKATRMVAAAASLTVAVQPNPYNTLAAQLSTKEAELNAREAQLAAESSSAGGQPASDMYGLASLAISIVLLILVAINFYFDRKARKKGYYTAPRKFSVDLR